MFTDDFRGLVLSGARCGRLARDFALTLSRLGRHLLYELGSAFPSPRHFCLFLFV